MNQEELSSRIYHADITPCGSRVTCDPPPVGTDADFLVFVHPDNLPTTVAALSSMSFHWEGNEHYRDAAQDGFMSWREGDTNLIVTANAEWARKHKLATALCKRLNLLHKEDRVAVFQAVLYSRTIA